MGSVLRRIRKAENPVGTNLTGCYDDRIQALYAARIKCTYTQHARERMAERGITELEVEETLDGHHTTYSDKKGNPIYIGRPNGRRIKVVVKLGSSPPRIITVAE